MAAVNGPRWSIFARAYGMETEYGLTCQINHKDGSIEMGDSIVAAKMLLTDYDHVSTFVSTGGRLYLDGETCTLCHVEYATPECLTPLSVALSHHAGDRILQRMAAERRRGRNEIHVIRNNRDYCGTSFGCHENYLVSRSVPFDQLVRSLVPYLVTGPLVFGPGDVALDRDYTHDPRAKIMNLISEDKTLSGERCIVNSRDKCYLSEPLDTQFRRLHITCRSANVSQGATFMKVATLSILLTMIENGWTFNGLYPIDPLAAMKECNTKIDGRALVKLADGSTMTAWNIQSVLQESARQFLSEQEGRGEIVPMWAKRAVRRWGEALRDIRDYDIDEWPESSYWVDWWVKHHALRSYLEALPDATDDELRTMELRYHHLDPRQSVAKEMVDAGLMEYLFQDHQLESASRNPSPHPRAQERAYWLQRRATGDSVSCVSWENVRVNGEKKVLRFF